MGVERMARRQGLGIGHIQRGKAQPPAIQRILQAC
jgi:hypothetical protein